MIHQTKLKLKRNDIFFTSLLGIYCIAILSFYVSSVANIGWDYYSYKSIALKYSEGYFIEALNAYWSPLISWLMVPLVKLNIAEHKEIIAINFFSGIVLLFLARKIVKQYHVKGFSQILFLIAILFYAITMQMVYFRTPDFLSAVCFIAYSTFVTDAKINEDKNYFLICTAIAFLCFFGKTFHAYFILLHLIGITCYYSFFSKQGNTIAIHNILKTFVLFLVGLGIWTILLSSKYNQFMFNSSGRYNLSIIKADGSKNHFGVKEGLFPPPDSHSYHHLVDPTYYPMDYRTKLTDYSSLNNQLEILNYNLTILNYSYLYFSYFGLFIFLLVILVFCIKNRKIRENLIFYFLSISSITFGYFLVFIEERYLLGVQILLFITAFLTIHSYYNQTLKDNFRKYIYYVVVIILFIGFMKNALFLVKDWHNRDTKYMSRILNYENKLFNLTILKNKKIATAFSHNEKEDLALFHICSKMNCQNYGNVGKEDTLSAQFQQLKKHDIDYFFYYGCAKTNSNNECIDRKLPFYLQGKTLVYKDAEYGLEIFSMKPY